ncbi:MAG: DUF998 domain-containing protein [Candidatus Lokiarchaeota archaeon]|nr:DUF998 domain-containing protein [Candidatus Lokiarchaeota archaeon]
MIQVNGKSKFGDSLFVLLPGGVFGVLSMLAGLIGEIIALQFYPEDYNLLSYMISDLGTPEMNPRGFMFFNIGAMVSGILGLPFSVYIGRLFQSRQGPSRWITLAKYANIVAYIALLLIGVCLALSATKESLFFLLHGVFADVCFLGTATYCVIYSYYIQDKPLVFPRYFAVPFFFAGIMQLVFIVTWVPLIEWISHLTILSWIIVFGSYTIFKKY